MRLKFGSQLTQDEQKQVLGAFVHRFTGDHKPAWAAKPRPNGDIYKVQFASDADWLANTEFKVTASGKLDQRSRYCFSHPTWPEGTDKGGMKILGGRC